MKALLSIGHDDGAVRATSAAILGILRSQADQKTIRVALRTLQASLAIGPTNISHCTFRNDFPEGHWVHADAFPDTDDEPDVEETGAADNRDPSPEQPS